jgi:hypothetical protein
MKARAEMCELRLNLLRAGPLLQPIWLGLLSPVVLRRLLRRRLLSRRLLWQTWSRRAPRCRVEKRVAVKASTAVASRAEADFTEEAAAALEVEGTASLCS